MAEEAKAAKEQQQRALMRVAKIKGLTEGDLSAINIKSLEDLPQNRSIKLHEMMTHTNRQTAERFTAVLLSPLSLSMNKITPAMIGIAAQLIVDGWEDVRLADVKLFVKMILRGELGEFYHRDVAGIMVKWSDYYELRQSLLIPMIEAKNRAEVVQKGAPGERELFNPKIAHMMRKKMMPNKAREKLEQTNEKAISYEDQIESGLIDESTLKETNEESDLQKILDDKLHKCNKSGEK